MGFSISWLAVCNRPAQTVLLQLGLQRTGEYDYVPDAPLSCADLTDGWFVILAKDTGFMDNLSLERLSIGADIVTCVVDEHVMFSSASAWHEGKHLWSVTHDASESMYHLEVKGRPPSELQAIRRQLQTAQKQAGGENSDVDHLFDVPVELAKAVTGIRHDAVFDANKPICETLTSVAADRCNRF